MSKLAPTSIKYIIKAQISAKGVIEKPDVIGAVFGQTEGLLGSDLDLRELQRTGKIGRIEVNIKSDKGNSSGEIIIPSALDAAETALIAATLETIERVGPCTAKITLSLVEDTRAIKREYVVNKAKMILKDLIEKGIPDTTKISEEIKETIRAHEITTYHGLPCGPDISTADEIIIVEGRADVINLLKFGIKNVAAIEGSSVPQPIVNLSKEKISTAFVDGDRGGALNLKALLETAEIDYIAIAPPGKEVEELSKKEVYKAIRDRISVEQYKLEEKTDKFKEFEIEKKSRPVQIDEVKSEVRVETRPRIEEQNNQYKKKVELGDEQKKFFRKTLEELIGSRAAYIFDSEQQLLGKVPVKELLNTLRTVDNPYAVIFDGKVDYRLNIIAKRKGIKYLVGMEKEDINSSVNIISKVDLQG
jgi:DNA primase